ncbi:folate-binding protein [Chelativorans sp. ZYF759]|uniref:CAF17-like 4Fe-4S cluster assembly/insertion protein YgfZ n=1 Tax=Chelativorans sp. ZYF759 TaxID=2692213 RepID=UPI00145E2076|nr:folate-binding protein YgfZ [Chelativorans sp. ZYF759]NMG39084.1 folate-binding protein [Chelativorans sp. ZYF759]
MPVIHLADRAMIRVAGSEAEHFLQNLVTTDLAGMASDIWKPGALLTPQGKIMFDFLVAHDAPDVFLIDCRADIASDLQRRLMLYKLRAKVEISVEEQASVAIAWEGDSDGSQTDSTGRRDMRFAELTVMRGAGVTPPATAEREAWDVLRVRHGVAESGSDYVLGDAFPHDVLLDQNGGVGMRKGCYVGQEVVSRMQHRGTARRRVLIVSAAADLPAYGTEIKAGGRGIGTLGTVIGREGLAIARIDRVKAAMDAGTPIEAEGVALALSIPAWAGFAFPDGGPQGGADE